MKMTKRILLVVAVATPAVAILAFWLFFRVMSVPSTSMAPRLENGDRLIVRKLDGAIPHRGDVLVFKKSESYLVKRVVAIAGDRIHIHEKKLYINGKELSEAYVTHLDPRLVPFRDEFPSDPGFAVNDPAWAASVESAVAAGDLAVPASRCFALGDNRDFSFDSRYAGFYRNDQIVGKPVMVLYSVEKVPGSFWGNFRWNRLFKLL